MASKTDLAKDIKFIKTPPAEPSAFEVEDCGVPLTNSPAIHNPPLPAEGAGAASFSNGILLALLIAVPWFVARLIGGGFKTKIFLGIVLLFPVLIVVWSWTSAFSPRLDEKAKLPGRPIETYLKFIEQVDMQRYSGRSKVPIHTFGELYVNGKVDVKADLLDVLEYRHDWATFNLTWDWIKFLLGTFARDVLVHSREQDMEQIRPNYDSGNDHYAWFLGPRMIYTSGVISDTTREETLEELQDNKMAIVCEKLELKEGEKLLDIGCGWGTLAKFASLNYGANVTGVTIAEKGAAYATDALRTAGVPEEQSRILCMDYRDIPKQKFNKISQLEMGEHVGLLKLTKFFRQCYDMLEDDGAMYVQLSGLRQAWQYEDFIWGIYLNKWIFRGADASTPLWNYIRSLERAGFEIKSVDTVGVHYSATIWRWYRNWLGNRDAIIAKYGQRWYRIWELFLAWSVIASRQGSATCFQILVVKNLNATHRINGVPSQFGLHGALAKSKAAGKASLPQ
ncbi:hypothetical protein S40285_09001 [Stachybotrys chlorohalonatus IBT 40285]|uniref:sphingolipid C(9)-methyltransferase n=1 Tax=Stachybotrys chlorohalonatus (strain IBT 40285) TaxID=1283841 RepID=A0A084Q8Z9_STAC4|nr:hypothetical protein S40285_09001 [Stachybotrys chlorohalonata IBT 40285]